MIFGIWRSARRSARRSVRRNFVLFWGESPAILGDARRRDKIGNVLDLGRNVPILNFDDK